jgi:hypothetical protein
LSELTNEPGRVHWPLPPAWPPHPRASLLHEGGGGLWMGGAQTPVGDPVQPADLAEALVIDCAGELPDRHLEAAGDFWPCVFLDVEGHPSQFARIAAVARAAAASLRTERGAAVYVFCQYGMNRSGLVAGLVLRELGYGPDESVGRIRAARRGSLSNLTFVDLIRAHSPQERREGGGT